MHLAKESGCTKAWRSAREGCAWELKEIQPVWNVVSEQENVRTEASKVWGRHGEPPEACLEFGFYPLKVLGETASDCSRGDNGLEYSRQFSGLCAW